MNFVSRGQTWFKSLHQIFPAVKVNVIHPPPPVLPFQCQLELRRQLSKSPLEETGGNVLNPHKRKGANVGKVT